MKNMEKSVKLSESQKRILEEGRTEPAFSSQLLEEKRDGTYSCAACDNKVFSSDTKFDSRSGWPSFYDVMANDSIEKNEGTDGRVEVTCAKCGGHLGHVFEDGPKPTGKRFCINGEVLKFSKK